jgi:hypothetical protein
VLAKVGQDQQEVVDTKHGVSRAESVNYFLLIFGGRGRV